MPPPPRLGSATILRLLRMLLSLACHLVPVEAAVLVENGQIELEQPLDILTANVM